jgi:2-polyprenyl-3-methyl-5-hydroxy-6-metoxy-1,4-benzoquinol methylase
VLLALVPVAGKWFNGFFRSLEFIVDSVVPGSLDWSRTSRDYAAYRPGYTDAHFALLAQLGVGLPGQRVLDLGCGTGALALPFARRGAQVTGVDMAPGQIAAAQALAGLGGLSLSFHAAEVEAFAEAVAANAFDVVSASMCWGYFDTVRLVPALHRVLCQTGLLLISSTTWALEATDPIAAASHALLAQHNPLYAQHRRNRGVIAEPAWAGGWFSLRTWHRYTLKHVFTQASWRGRLRASKWVGAGMSEEAADAFDGALADVLQKIAPPEFLMPHRVCIEIYEKSSQAMSR